jgi:hypothetical protein
LIQSNNFGNAYLEEGKEDIINVYRIKNRKIKESESLNQLMKNGNLNLWN